MLMQSTGHGATHRSQPVHSDAIMVCISLVAPAIASTGQAGKHSVQPMQRCSSMNATALGLITPFSALSGLASTPSNCASWRIPSSPPGGH